MHIDVENPWRISIILNRKNLMYMLINKFQTLIYLILQLCFCYHLILYIFKYENIFL